MSAISFAKELHPFCLLLITFLILLFHFILHSELAILEKTCFLAIVLFLEIAIVTFEAWRVENSEDEEPKCQVEWHIPRYYGFNLVKEEATCNPYKLDFNGYGEDE